MQLDLSNTVDIKKGQLYFTKLVEGKSKIELKKITAKRTISLNSYLHVCVTIYAIHFGYSLYESKIFLKRKCDFMVYEKNGVKYLKQTSKLDNSDCSKFVEFIRNFSAQNGCYVPSPEEYKSNKFEIDREINNQKQYL